MLVYVRDVPSRSSLSSLRIPILAPAAALLVILATDGWRTGMLVAIAGGAVLATRIRFCSEAAAALLVVVAVAVVTGHGISAS